MKHSRWAFGLLACGVAGASAAEAQVTPESILRGTNERKVDLRATADIDYDSNLIRTTPAQAAPRGLSLSDTVYTPAVNLNILQPVGRQVVFLKGDVSYLFHQNNKQLDSNRIDAAVGVGNKLGPCGSTLVGDYARGRNELLDTTLQTTVENILQVKRLDGAITCSRPTGLGVLMTGARVEATTSDKANTSGDYNTTTAGAGVIYSRPSTGSIGLMGNYARTEYPGRLPVPGGSSGYELVAGSINLERQLGGRIQATASLSYSRVKLLDAIPAPGLPALSDFKGLTYSAALTLRASSRLHGQAQFQRQISPTLIQGQTYEIQTNFNVSADYKFGSRITATLGAREQESDARGNTTATMATLPLLLKHSTTKSAYGSIRYLQSKRISVVLNAQRETRAADNPTYDYKSDRVGIAIAVNY